MHLDRATLRKGAGVLVAMAVLIAVVVGWPRRASQADSAGGIWTCSMHPQIRMDHFDRCPLCGMDLVPVKSSSAGAAAHADRADHLELSEHAQRMARIGTTKIDKRPLHREIRTVGKIEFDETRMKQIASRVNGRVEQVFADFTGTMVKLNDHLVKIYSPDLVATQEEFLTASRREQDLARGGAGSLSLAASARRRLLLWGITEEQIAHILATGRPETHMIVYASQGGTVVEKMVRAGQYVKEGETLFTIADLEHVWLIVEIYETDLPWVRFGQSVQVTLEGDAAVSFVGQVGFIEPVVNDQTRTIRVRVILKNSDGKLKPGMFAQALIQVSIMPDGTPAPTGLEGKFACPMHPYVVSDTPGLCRVCEMELELIPGQPATVDQPPAVLAVPAEAVLNTGRRQLVYVDSGAGMYRLVEPHLGPRAGDFYPILHGLNEGDVVVTRGNFLLDSQFQITGKPSLLYPQGMTGGGHAGHAHGATGTVSNSAATDDALWEQNVGKLPTADRETALRQRTCPITGKPLGSMGVPVKLEVEGQSLFVCCAGCTAAVRQDPQAALGKLGRATQ